MAEDFEANDGTSDGFGGREAVDVASDVDVVGRSLDCAELNDLSRTAAFVGRYSLLATDDSGGGR